MKKIITLFLIATSALSFAQGPIIEGTYLPVAGTKVKEAWVTTVNTFSIPATGTNVVWNYVTPFANTTYTSEVATGLADTTKFHEAFDNKIFSINNSTYTATHAVYVRAPYNGLPDSTYNYLVINKKGLYNVGSYVAKKMYDSAFVNTIPELLIPDSAKYGMTAHDSSRYIGYAKKVYFSGNYYKALIRGVKVKDISGAGYGTLMLPNATYNNVLLAKSVVSQKDSVYIDYNGNGNYFDDYIFSTPTRTLITNNSIDYYFVRNNTFGSAYCAWISANPSNTQTGHGWYSLPVDTGTIKGTVFTNSLAVANATAGVAYLYREASNFAKDDILATTPLDANGNYQFNSIPYGLYRIAIRPNLTVYPNAFTTYFGDATDWLQPQTGVIQTFGQPLTTVGPIHLQYYQTLTGQGSISGNLVENLLANFKVAQNNVPGVGTVVKKKPGGLPIIGGVSGGTGSFSYNNLDNGDYELFVDIPGLNMACSYTFNINGATTISNLDYTVGNYSINATYTNNPNNSCSSAVVTSLTNENKNTHSNLVSVYPNPYQGQTTIKVTLADNENVSLEVFNSLGQKVQTLDNSTKSAGEYKYQFSAKNLNLSNGLYFLKLKTNHQQQVIKLIEQ